MSIDSAKKYLNWFAALVALPLLPLAAQGQLPIWAVWIAFGAMTVFSVLAIVAAGLWLYQPIKHQRLVAEVEKAIDVDSHLILLGLEKAGDSTHTLMVGNLLQTWVDEGVGNAEAASALYGHLRTIGASARSLRLLKEAKRIGALQVHQTNEQLVDSYIQICQTVAQALLAARMRADWIPSKSRLESDWPKVLKQLHVFSGDMEKLSKRINFQLKGYGARECFSDVPRQ